MIEENRASIIVTAHHYVLKDTTVASGEWEGMQLGRRRVSIRSVLACCIVAVPLSNELPAPTFQDGPTLSQADLLTDFDGWISGMHALNPDLSIRADMQMLERESARIRAELTGPMSRREAWLHFAQLNPHLRDAHAGIQMPDYRGAMAAHLKAGGHVVGPDADAVV